MSLLRRARAVFCTFFFAGDECTASLAPDPATAFSAADTSGAGAVAPLSAETAATAVGDDGRGSAGGAAAAAWVRPRGSRAITGLSTVLRIRTMRGLGM